MWKGFFIWKVDETSNALSERVVEAEPLTFESHLDPELPRHGEQWAECQEMGLAEVWIRGPTQTRWDKIPVLEMGPDQDAPHADRPCYSQGCGCLLWLLVSERSPGPTVETITQRRVDCEL